MSLDRPPSTDPWAAMASPVRRFVLEELASRETGAQEIAELVQQHFGIGWPAVTRHLKILTASGLVRVRREWSARLYRLDDEAPRRLTVLVDEVARRWSRRTGGGYHSRYDPEEDPWPSVLAQRRPRDADEEMDRILLEFGFDPETGTPLRNDAGVPRRDARADRPEQGLADWRGV